MFRSRNKSADQKSRRPAWFLIAPAVATVVAFSAICASVMLDMRRSEEELARQSSENLATTIDSDISRNIELYDLSLRAVVQNMTMPELDQVSKPIRQLILFDHAATAHHFGAIQVFDASGNLTIDAASLDPVKENRASEAFFSVHRDHPDTGLFISQPTLHRGSYAIVLSRRITGADGSFRGVVAGSIRFSYFHNLFGRLTLGKQDVITVIRRDGTIIMRRPFNLDVIGRNVARMASRLSDVKNVSRSFSDISPIDGVSRFYVALGTTPEFVVFVGKSWDSIYASWRHEVVRIGGIILALNISMLLGSIFLTREIGRRASAESKLAELATTDGLTGLCNRRKFDESYDIEWRRAARQGLPLALIMIDADYFKSYNDRFGHQAGDKVLTTIAGCIAKFVRRAGECAARYGGEEFALLLPGLSTDEVLIRAEQIRAEIETRGLSQNGITISAGVACLVPTAAMDAAVLLQSADEALYEAKATGRNCCCLARPPQLTLVA